MASPILIGTTPITVAPSRNDRNIIRFQNTGSSIIFLKKISGLGTPPVSPTDYEILLRPFVVGVSSSNPSVATETTSKKNGNGNGNNDNGNNGNNIEIHVSLEGDPFETDSVLAFQAISSAPNGILAIYETVNVD